MNLFSRRSIYLLLSSGLPLYQYWVSRLSDSSTVPVTCHKNSRHPCFNEPKNFISGSKIRICRYTYAWPITAYTIPFQLELARVYFSSTPAASVQQHSFSTETCITCIAASTEPCYLSHLLLSLHQTPQLVLLPSSFSCTGPYPANKNKNPLGPCSGYSLNRKNWKGSEETEDIFSINLFEEPAEICSIIL